MYSDEATKRWIRRSAWTFLGVSVAVTAPLVCPGQRTLPSPAPPESRTEESLASPISFEPNLGQAETRVKFMARGPGYILYLTDEGALFSFEQPESHAGAESYYSLAVKFVGANAVPKLAAKDELMTQSSYFLGADPKKWRTGIPNYARVTIENIYPGIDVVYHGTQGRLQYHFLIAPGAKPSRITLAISGANDPQLDDEGNLTLRSGQTKLRLYKPTAYQEVSGNKRSVGARYVVRHGRIKFAFTERDGTKPLVIDPILNYAAYLSTPDAVLGPRPSLTDRDQVPGE